MRLGVRDAKQVATCLEFGPRYLHSTGQAYKGGPNSGVFLEITCDHPKDLDDPGPQSSPSRVVEKAQALGDFAVLNDAWAPRVARSSQGRGKRPRRPCGTPSQKPCNRIDHAAWNRGAGADGRQYRPPADEGTAMRWSSTITTPRRSTASPKSTRALRTRSMIWCSSLKPPRAVWVMLPAGEPTEYTIAALAELPRQRRRRHRRRQHLLQRRHPPREDAARKGHRTMSMSAPPAASGDWSAAIA